jgi:hypothetical protein
VASHPRLIVALTQQLSIDQSLLLAAQIRLGKAPRKAARSNEQGASDLSQVQPGRPGVHFTGSIVFPGSYWQNGSALGHVGADGGSVMCSVGRSS